MNAAHCGPQGTGEQDTHEGKVLRSFFLLKDFGHVNSFQEKKNKKNQKTAGISHSERSSWMSYLFLQFGGQVECLEEDIPPTSQGIYICTAKC